MHGRARHTGAAWQPQGKISSPAVLQGHTAAHLEAIKSGSHHAQTLHAGASLEHTLSVLFAGARSACSWSAGAPRAPPQIAVIWGVNCLQVLGAEYATLVDK